MHPDTQEKLAASLTVDDVDLLEFLPYILQDLWELGSFPKDILTLLQKHTTLSEKSQILDLACGKGASAIQLAKTFGCPIKGIDIIPDFIEEAKIKATEYGVAHLCEFVVGDVNDAIRQEQNYDCVIWGAVGDILGDFRTTVRKIRRTLKPNGYIVIDDGYSTDEPQTLDYQAYEYLTMPQWLKLFDDIDLDLLGYIESDDSTMKTVVEETNKKLISRAKELIIKHPNKKKLFEKYIEDLSYESLDIDDTIIALTWLLQLK